MIFGLFARVFVKVYCFCVLYLVFTSVFLKTHAVFMLCCVKSVLFFEKYSRVYGLQLNALIIAVGGSHGMATAGGLVGFYKWHLEE